MHITAVKHSHGARSLPTPTAAAVAEEPCPDCHDERACPLPLARAPLPTGTPAATRPSPARVSLLASSALTGGVQVMARLTSGAVGMVSLAETEACFKCKGSGECQQDWPAGSGVQSTGAKCSSCNGTGKCPQCKGTGLWQLVKLPAA